MSHQDWVDLAWWMCFAGAFIVTLLLAHVVAIVAVELLFAA